MMVKRLKKFKRLKSDQEAIDEVANIDLSEYDFSDFKPVQYEFLKKTASLDDFLAEDGLLKSCEEQALKEISAAGELRGLIDRAETSGISTRTEEDIFAAAVAEVKAKGLLRD